MERRAHWTRIDAVVLVRWLLMAAVELERERRTDEHNVERIGYVRVDRSMYMQERAVDRIHGYPRFAWLERGIEFDGFQRVVLLLGTRKNESTRGKGRGRERGL